MKYKVGDRVKATNTQYITGWVGIPAGTTGTIKDVVYEDDARLYDVKFDNVTHNFGNINVTCDDDDIEPIGDAS